MAIDLGLAIAGISLVAAVIGLIKVLIDRSRPIQSKENTKSTTIIKEQKIVEKHVLIPVRSNSEKRQEPQQIEETLVDVTKIIEEGENADDEEFWLNKGDIVSCNVKSDGLVDVLLMNERNFNKFLDAGDFTYFGYEDVTQCRINETIDKTGKWYLVIENVDEGDVEVKIKLTRVAS